MKPLYKFKMTNKTKKKKKKISIPSLRHPLSNNKDFFPGWGCAENDTPADLRVHTTVHIWRTPWRHDPPPDESSVGGQPAEVRQRRKTALIALMELRPKKTKKKQVSFRPITSKCIVAAAAVFVLCVRGPLWRETPWVCVYFPTVYETQLQWISTRLNGPMLLFYSEGHWNESIAAGLGDFTVSVEGVCVCVTARVAACECSGGDQNLNIQVKTFRPWVHPVQSNLCRRSYNHNWWLMSPRSFNLWRNLQEIPATVYPDPNTCARTDAPWMHQKYWFSGKEMRAEGRSKGSRGLNQQIRH